jgi:hypothetical protein
MKTSSPCSRLGAKSRLSTGYTRRLMAGYSEVSSPAARSGEARSNRITSSQPAKRSAFPTSAGMIFRHSYRAMMDQEKLTLEEQRALMRHEDIRTTLGYGGKSKAETVRGANARVVEC